MTTKERLVAHPRQTLAAVTLAATTASLAACAPAGPDTQPMPRGVSPGATSTVETSWLGPGTALGVIGLAVAAGIWRYGDTEVPGHRASDGPAAAAARARRSVHRAVAIAVAAPAVAALFWAPVAHHWHLLGISLCASLVAALFAHHHSVVQRGADLADERWQREAADAERAGQPTPPEPVVGSGDLRRLGETRGFERPDGSAAATLLDVAGRDRPLRATWLRVAQSQGMGKVNESGQFVSWARIDEVQVEPNGDVTVWWRLTELGKTAGSMSGCKAVLQHELRVKEMSGFETEFSTGRVSARFSNGTSAPTTKAERPAPPRPATPAPADDDWDA